MSKLLGGLLVGVTTSALFGAVVAAEQTKAGPQDAPAHAAGAATAGDDADVGRSPAYNAELQKCDAMTGVEKTRCVIAAEEKHSAAVRPDENASEQPGVSR